jgi:hypothetical protein
MLQPPQNAVLESARPASTSRDHNEEKAGGEREVAGLIPQSHPPRAPFFRTYTDFYFARGPDRKGMTIPAAKIPNPASRWPGGLLRPVSCRSAAAMSSLLGSRSVVLMMSPGRKWAD